MALFLLVVALARTCAPVRLAVESFLVIHCFGHKRWDIALFIAGMLLAELEVMLPRKPQSRSKRRLVNMLLFATLLLDIFFSGYPRDGNTKTPGYMWSKHVWTYTAYRRRFWLAMGAILIVGPMAFLPGAQALFLTRPARYLGRISFALYLVHGLGNRTIGTWLVSISWGLIGNEGAWRYGISFCSLDYDILANHHLGGGCVLEGRRHPVHGFCEMAREAMRFKTADYGKGGDTDMGIRKLVLSVRSLTFAVIPSTS
ncbi:hypothetical protein DL770_011890 [Monosporascus sp. CRB-9-2]|nr:hypothetical protein DL770_011890 [Monosporascus sp. CRB-9-2]